MAAAVTFVVVVAAAATTGNVTHTHFVAVHSRKTSFNQGSDNKVIASEVLGGGLVDTGNIEHTQLDAHRGTHKQGPP